MIDKDFYFRGNGTFHLKGHTSGSSLTDILSDVPTEARMHARLVV
jgi:hypothetical protein